MGEGIFTGAHLCHGNMGSFQQPVCVLSCPNKCSSQTSTYSNIQQYEYVGNRLQSDHILIFSYIVLSVSYFFSPNPLFVDMKNRVGHTRKCIIFPVKYQFLLIDLIWVLNWQYYKSTHVNIYWIDSKSPKNNHTALNLVGKWLRCVRTNEKPGL